MVTKTKGERDTNGPPNNNDEWINTSNSITILCDVLGALRIKLTTYHHCKVYGV